VAFVTGEVVVAGKINKDKIREVFNNGIERVLKGCTFQRMEMPCKMNV